MQEDHLLQKAISAARAGHELTARDIFLEIVEINPRREIAWMWLTGLLDELDDCIYACEMVLNINPGNVNARQYLDQLLVKKQMQVEGEKIRAEEQTRQARELLKSGQRDAALVLAHTITRSDHAGEDAWRLLAEMTPEPDERMLALEKLLAFAPSDTKARQELNRLRHFKDDPLDLAAMYEEQGNLQKAVETYKLALVKAGSKSQWNRIYHKLTLLENLMQENIAYVSPRVSVARLAGGPPLVYFLMLLIHVGLNPIADPEPFLWIGFFWVMLGGVMIALASVRSHSRLWSLLFKDAGSGGTPAARFSMAAAGWILVLLPFVLLFWMAFNRLFNFDVIAYLR